MNIPELKLFFFLTVNFGQHSYRACYDLFLGASKMGTSVEVTKPKENLKMFEFGALYERSSNAHTVQVLVSNPFTKVGKKVYKSFP